ncbi:MAG: glycosyltransferase family 2 protein [Ilumatobacter sp.]|nr:glycosyltransferase family 2 protein [Ilumatobacter sp.]
MSAVICTRNREDQIGRAVASVLANDYPSFELTVIDQSTSDATEQALADLIASDSRLRYVHRDEAGLSRAYNAGIEATDGAILAFTDDDCVADPGWISSIVGAFREHPDATLLYGEVVPFGQTADDRSKTPILTFDRAQRLTKRDGFNVIGMGANFAARRSLFDHVGTFDTYLGGGGPLRSAQDFDLVYRALIADGVVLLRPDVSMRHDGRREEEDWPGLLDAYGTGEGAFYTKHVRCGDLRALWMLSKRLGRHTAKWIVFGIQRKKPTERYFVRGMLTGVRRSFEFGVDRSTRLYVER